MIIPSSFFECHPFADNGHITRYKLAPNFFRRILRIEGGDLPFSDSNDRQGAVEELNMPLMGAGNLA